MDKRKNALRFARYLENLEHGKDVNPWLEKNANIAEETIAMGKIAQALKSMRPEENVLENSEKISRQNLLDAALRQVAPARITRHSLWQRIPLLQRAAMIGAIVLICLTSIGGGIVYASNTSLPGDRLYGVKLAREDTQRFFTQDTSNRIILEERLSNQRLMEVTAVLENQRKVAVRFDGILYDMQPDHWIINNLLVQMPSNTPIDGNPTLGCYIDVRAQATPQWQLIATAIKVEGATYTGLLKAIESDFLTIDGITVAINPAMLLNPAVQVGDAVFIHTRNLPNGEQYTYHIEPEKETSETRHTELRGILEIIDATQWRIGANTFLITPQTHIEGSYNAGDQIKVTVVRLLDGTLFAIEIEPASDHNETPALNLVVPDGNEEMEPEIREETPEAEQGGDDDTEHMEEQKPEEIEEGTPAPQDGGDMDNDDHHDSDNDEDSDHEDHGDETQDHGSGEHNHESEDGSDPPESGEDKDKEDSDG